MRFLGIALWGLHMGLTQGVLARLITGMALVAAAMSLAYRVPAVVPPTAVR